MLNKIIDGLKNFGLICFVFILAAFFYSAFVRSYFQTEAEKNAESTKIKVILTDYQNKN